LGCAPLRLFYKFYLSKKNIIELYSSLLVLIKVYCSCQKKKKTLKPQCDYWYLSDVVK